MKYFYLAALFFLSFWDAMAQESMRLKVNFGSGWEFRREESNLQDWEKITIPHTAKVEPLIVNDQFQGICRYRKKFRAPCTDTEKTCLYFEGVMQQADIFIDGKQVASHKGGYLPFTVDITGFVKSGKEIMLSLKVTNTDNPEIPPGKPLKDLDFNYYGGIYRNVYLIRTNKLYITDAVNTGKIAGGGVFVNFSAVDAVHAYGSLQVNLKNEFSGARTVSLKFTLTDDAGKKTVFKSENTRINGNSDKTITQNIAVPNPKLWSVNAPNLYHVKIEVLSGKKTIDALTLKTGIRKSEIRNDGYYLNGEKLFISGTNRHQEYPYLGYAISDQAQYRDAVKIKNAGFDLVRLSHYPQAEAFLSACDELGILVMASIPGWQFFGDGPFREEAVQNIRDMARRDRNHPGIVFWEVSLNESNMSEDFIKKATAALHEELPFPGHYTAGWMDNPNYDLFIPARQHAKAPDYWSKYQNGDRKIFIAEYGDWEYYAQNAGFSQKEFANLKQAERTSRQLRSDGEKRLLQQAYNFQQGSNSNRKGAQTIGEANWLMFDYNRGYSNDLESSGISDIFRIPKFAYAFYRSQRDAEIVLKPELSSGPMVSIASYWMPDSATDVTVYSNCQEVALYLDGILVSKEKPSVTADSDLLKHPPFIFRMGKFKAGTLKAEGFIDGKKVVETSVKSAEAAVKIQLAYDLSAKAINPDFPDTVFVYAKITDRNGTVIPDAKNPVTFILEAKDAALIGENPVKAEAGVAGIILRTDTFRKPLKISASSPGLESAILEIRK